MFDSNILKGRRILITSYSFANFGGAELNAVEFADEAVKLGMIPTFFTYDKEGPLCSYIENRYSTTIITDSINQLSESDSEDDMGNTKLSIEDYDYIWVGGNTVPISILKQINDSVKLPKFIFIHMSSLIAFPLDAPLMPDFEKQIASKILSVGRDTTKNSIKRIMGEDIRVFEWYNPAPVEYSLLKERRGVLKKIAVISSSYPTDEIMGIGDILSSKGIEVDYVGKFNNNVKIVDADFYDKYDLIIGIGKNAKYSLVSGVPIYLYGRFGGPGYLHNVKDKKPDEINFSGRGFGKKTTNYISNDIIKGYEKSVAFHKKNRDHYIEKFSIDRTTVKLLSELEYEENKSLKLSKEYVNWLVSTQINLMQRHFRTVWLRSSEERLFEARVKIKNLKARNEVLVRTNDKLRKDIANIYNSKSWILTKPLRVISKKFKFIIKDRSKK